MAALPTPYTVAHKRYDGGAVDAHGNPKPSWLAPVDLKVHAIAPGAMEVDRDGTRDLSKVLYTLLCPAGTTADIKDLIGVDGTDYAIEGEPKDWSRGPWHHPTAGVQIYLKAVEG